MAVTCHPPHRSERAELPHTAPASGKVLFKLILMSAQDLCGFRLGNAGCVKGSDLLLVEQNGGLLKSFLPAALDEDFFPFTRPGS